PLGSFDWGIGGFRGRLLGPGDRKASHEQLMRRNLERTARHDIMTHTVAGFLAAFLAGAAGVQTDRFHPLRTFTIAIRATAGLPTAPVEIRVGLLKLVVGFPGGFY